MGKGRTVMFLLIVLFIGLTSATSLDPVTQGEDAILFQSCDTCTYVNLDSVKYPNGTLQNFGVAMTKVDQSYNYTFTQTDEIGGYIYTVCGDKDGSLDCETIDFIVSYGGEDVDTPQAILLLAQLGLVALFFGFGRVFGDSKWKIKSLFDILSIMMALILVNSIRFVAAQSSSLNEMAKLGFIIVSTLLGFMLLYVFIYATIEVVQYFKTKKDKKWNIS